MNSTSAPSVRAHSLTPYLPGVVAALLGFGLAWFRLGLDVLNPTDVTWFRGDPGWHFLVWNFFRYEPWHLQPGHVANMMAPLGTSIGSGDAIPLLAFPFKLLSPLLPSNFQYLGLWLFLSYALQAVFGYLLAAVFIKNRWRALLVGLFFLVSPVMIFRAGHVALSAHWLILVALWLYFAESRTATLELRPYRTAWAVNVGLAGLVHPYLTAMVIPIAVASLLRETFHSKRLGPLHALSLLAFLAVLLAFEWWLSGLIGVGQNLESWGFNHFTMNLNAPFNPQGKSYLLPTLPNSPGQYEGFAFLGTGILALGVLVLVRSWRELGGLLRCAALALFRSGHLALLLFSLLFVGYAVGDGLTFGETLVPNYSVFKNFPSLISAFRAPGRFFWPTYYLIYLVLFVLLFRLFSPRRATLLLLAGLTLQVVDLKINRPFVSGQETYRTHLKSERWPELIGAFSRVVVTPAFDRDVAGRNDFIDFSFLASRHGTELTTGAAARPHLRQAQARRSLERQALVGPRGTEALYVFSARTFAAKYYEDLEPGLRCHPLNAYLVCHNSDRDLGLGDPVDTATFVPRGLERTTLTDFVARYGDHTVVLAVNGGPGKYSLDIKRYLSARGSKVGTIGVLRGSYLAVLHRGALVFEDISDNEPVVRDWEAGTVLGEGEAALTLPEDLYVYSSGIPAHKAASTATADEAHNADGPGFSVLILDDAFDVVVAADFDTHVSDTALLERRPKARPVARGDRLTDSH